MSETLSETTVETKIVPRLKTKYAETIKKSLQDEFSYANVNQVPRLVKVVVNMGVGDAAKDSKLIDGAVRDLTLITGQKPQVTKGPQVDRTVQAARRHADRCTRNSAWRPHVGIRGPSGIAGSAAYP
ncbi:hypothetical protein StoSoilB13_16850 [Arthrobacter sp. StoSoilB13]|nr:hypothetical protein StoSoilB13_16850 [Arthrobacter sp. StoSoilB13]